MHGRPNVQTRSRGTRAAAPWAAGSVVSAPRTPLTPLGPPELSATATTAARRKKSSYLRARAIRQRVSVGVKGRVGR